VAYKLSWALNIFNLGTLTECWS